MLPNITAHANTLLGSWALGVMFPQSSLGRFVVVLWIALSLGQR